MPCDLMAPREQRVLETKQLDEPLAAADDLERPVALLVELHDVADWLGFADQSTALAQQLGDPAPRLLRRFARELAHGRVRRLGILRLPPRLAEATGREGSVAPGRFG